MLTASLAACLKDAHCLQPYDNALLRVELLPPKKAEALAYLDGNGPEPLRQGLCIVPCCCQPHKGYRCIPASHDLGATWMVMAPDQAGGVVHCVHCALRRRLRSGADVHTSLVCLSVCIFRPRFSPCRYALAIVQRGEMDPPDIMEYSVSHEVPQLVQCEQPTWFLRLRQHVPEDRVCLGNVLQLQSTRLPCSRPLAVSELRTALVSKFMSRPLP